MTFLRLFLALWPEPPACAAIEAAQQALAWHAGARLTPPGNLHLTLHFIGAMPEDQLGQVLAAADLPTGRIGLQLDQLDIWKGATAVLRPSSVPAGLLDLHARLAQALHAAGLHVDDRPYRPHVTLARKALGLEPQPIPALAWQSSGHVLAASEGGRYRVLRRFAPPGFGEAPGGEGA